LFLRENGLQVASKKFDNIEQIYLVEFISNDEKLLIIGKGLEEGEKGLRFIIWDLYNTGKVESTKLENFPMEIIKNIGTRLARTSGNIYYVDDDGNVRSILERIENELLEQKNKEKAEKAGNNLEKLKESHITKFIGTKLNGNPDESNTIWFDKNINPTFKPIIFDKEPWVLGDYERNSYCLYQDKKETRIETLQLIVGRSTVQIWHQIQDDSKNKEHLPNKGEPFLEYIWTNRIPVNQEREETRLRIDKFEYGSNDGLHDKLGDFYLEVHWYVRNNDENVETNENINKAENVKNEIMKENKEINKIEKIFNENNKIDKEKMNIKQELKEYGGKLRIREKIIKREDIEKFRAVKHACKALEHLNKRYKYKYFVDNYSKIHEVCIIKIFNKFVCF
jgi:hypothetical protein